MSPSALFVTTVPITLEAFLLPYADRFRAQGWRIDALANGSTLVPALKGHFDRRFDVGWSRNPLDPSNLWGATSRVREVVASNGYNIVHVHTPIAAFVTRLAIHRLDASARPVVIYTAHGFHFYDGQQPLAHALYRFMERIAAPWTDYLVTINDEDCRAAMNLGVPGTDRVRLIRGIGVDTNRYRPKARGGAPVRESLGVGSDAFMLTMVAEFAPVKRHELLFKALARCAADVKVVLVGDGPLEARLRQTAARLRLTDRVIWAGYRTDVAAILDASDALALVSEREGLPRSVLEAMACALPVIGTDTRGIHDAVGSVAGWIVGKNDVAALAAAIDEAASRPDERRRRGELARERVERLFSLEIIAQQYEELYREALASRV